MDNKFNHPHSLFSIRADVVEFLIRAHGSQVRKYTNEPYVLHPIAVARIVANVTCHEYDNEEIIIAALLHDVVEDTSYTLKNIEDRFGYVVASLVEMVTDVSKPSDGNRKVRKEIDRQHLAKASPWGKTIKLADLIDNTRSIVTNDPDFARVYMREKRELLEVLSDGNPVLFKEASDIVAHYFASLPWMRQ